MKKQQPYKNGIQGKKFRASGVKKKSFDPSHRPTYARKLRRYLHFMEKIVNK